MSQLTTKPGGRHSAILTARMRTMQGSRGLFARAAIEGTPSTSNNGSLEKKWKWKPPVPWMLAKHVHYTLHFACKLFFLRLKFNFDLVAVWK